jgi:DNA-binding NarL/FixJ family response regulator
MTRSSWRARSAHGATPSPANPSSALRRCVRASMRRRSRRRRSPYASSVRASSYAEPWACRSSAAAKRSSASAGSSASTPSGETARKRDVTTMDDLTPQELRIAELVAAGASNREVAAQLFVSRRTVEHHLSRVFAKLGIASRGELARALRGAED